MTRRITEKFVVLSSKEMLSNRSKVKEMFFPSMASQDQTHPVYSDHTVWLLHKEAGEEQVQCVYKTEVSEGAGEGKEREI